MKKQEPFLRAGESGRKNREFHLALSRQRRIKRTFFRQKMFRWTILKGYFNLFGQQGRIFRQESYNLHGRFC